MNKKVSSRTKKKTLIMRFNGLNYMMLDGKAVEVETQVPVVQVPVDRPCDRCGLTTTAGLTCIQSPPCIARPTTFLCRFCLNAAVRANAIGNGRYRLRAICSDHIHQED